MKKIIISIIMLSIPAFSYANCWIVSGLQGKSSFNDDNYKFIDDGMTGVAIKLSINGNAASVTNLDGSSISDVTYVPLSSNTIIGSYQAGGGITVETWSITDDKKVMYSKVMNIPKMQKLTSTKAFVGNVAGSCDN
ncbi:hypothetical protein SAMN03097705_3529 [[Enterobacter] aerogenes]|uniref:hypothetical protein n=1 Tax=Klebsiella aerogenes TaxID=548 RepID=UPI00091A0D3C|nr:hypothetical protein [Klebsiella aerogenes]SFX55508.1 hypothetical protein SAMN03097705_3529 [[Enterobacter] aerogenes] [Klebsiella aerogenes]